MLEFVALSGNSRLNILSIYQKSRIIGRAIAVLYKQVFLLNLVINFVNQPYFTAIKCTRSSSYHCLLIQR